MRESPTSHAPIDAVLTRVAHELGAAACELAELEAGLAAGFVEGRGAASGVEQLQGLDAIGQRLRALETFLFAAAPRTFGLTDLLSALDHVRLEGVRARLAGGEAPIAFSGEAELW